MARIGDDPDTLSPEQLARRLERGLGVVRSWEARERARIARRRAARADELEGEGRERM